MVVWLLYAAEVRDERRTCVCRRTCSSKSLLELAMGAIVSLLFIRFDMAHIYIDRTTCCSCIPTSLRILFSSRARIPFSQGHCQTGVLLSCVDIKPCWSDRGRHASGMAIDSDSSCVHICNLVHINSRHIPVVQKNEGRASQTQRVKRVQGQRFIQETDQTRTRTD